MKLLLDEMLSGTVAERLRQRGRDVIAVCERSELRGITDAELLEHAQREQRALVTYNRDDFLVLDRQYRAAGLAHHGIVILNPRRFPQRPGTVGQMVAALDAFVAEGAPYAGFVHWLG